MCGHSGWGPGWVLVSLAQRTEPRQDGGQPGEGTSAWTLKFGKSGLESIDRAGCAALGSGQGVFHLPLHSHSPHSPHSLSCWGWLWGSCLGRWKKGKWSLYSSSSCPTGSSQAAGSFCPRSQVLLSRLLRTGLLLPGCGNRSAPTLGAQGGYGPRTHYNCRGHVTS